MRVWPFSYSLNDDIGQGMIHWVRDQFANFRMALLIRRSKRIDRLIESAGRSRDRAKL
jgi:hypothetical protein